MDAKVLMALDCFLGKTAEEVAKANDCSPQTVGNAKRMFTDSREDILRCYFKTESREAVATKFPPPPQKEEFDSKGIEERVATLERDMALLMKLAKAASPIIEHKPEPEPLPSLDIGSTSPKDTSRDVEYEDTFASDDPRADSTMRIHVTHQAVSQWKEAFGSGSADGSAPDENAIRRRIIGVYWNGTIEGKGQVFSIKGINRYAMEGVVIKCILQNDRRERVVFISQVEKVGIEAM